VNTLIAVDDGLSSGNLNWADIFFLLGTILAVLGALAHSPLGEAVTKYAWVLLSLAVAFIAFGLFLL
jgi:hypothetical protein